MAHSSLLAGAALGLALGLTLAPSLTSSPAMAGGIPEDAEAATTRQPSAQPTDFSRNTLKVQPGVLTVVRVAQGFTNRIVTPFAAFDLMTESPERFDIRGGVFYVAPGSDRPISLFLTPKGDESVAISLTLKPEPIPPAEIQLQLVNAAGALVLPASLPSRAQPRAAMGQRPQAGPGPYAQAALPEAALPSRESGPYEAGLAEMLQGFAAGHIPQGFASASLTAAHPRCRHVEGLTADFSRGQRYIGPAYEVFIGLVSNSGTRQGAFQEPWCAGPSVAAVALWPQSLLWPGDKAEIFVVRRRVSTDGTLPGRSRPSLIGRR